jgi:predicted permease
VSPPAPLVWRLARTALPRDFRTRHGAELLDAAQVHLEGSAGVRRAVGWLRASLDLVATGVRLRARRVGWRRLVTGGLVQDVGAAARGLARRPAFAALAVATLALGIGVNAGVFSAVNGVLLRPLPYEEPERIGLVWHTFGGGAQDLPAVHPLDARDYREWSTTLDDVTIATGFDGILGGTDRPAVVDVGYVEAGFFDFFGVTPLLGRTIDPAEDDPGDAPVALLSHRLWTARYGSDPDIVGTTVRLGAVDIEVIGVLPASFRLLLPAEAFRLRDAELWVSLRLDPGSLPPRNYTGYTAFVRRAPGVDFTRAQAELESMAARLRERHPEHASSQLRARIEPLRTDVVKGAEGTLLVLFGAVGLVLLIACANVANLMLARGQRRRSEMAIRTAMGAHPWRLIRLTLLESALLSAAGVAVGGLLAAALTRGLATWGPPGIPRLDSIAVDPTVLAFAACAGVACTFAVGAVPSWLASRTEAAPVLKTAGRTRTVRSRGPLKKALIVAQVAASLVVLVATGLLVRSFATLQEVDPGFEPGGVLTFRMALAPGTVDGGDELRLLQERLGRRLAALPGATRAAFTTQLPLTGSGPLQPYAWNEETAEQWESVTADRRGVSGEFFAAAGARLVQGEGFTGDPEEDRGTIVVDDRLAARAFGEGDAVGRLLQVEPNTAPEEERYRRVVGVVEHLRLHDVAAPHLTQIWEPGVGSSRFSVLVRSEGDPMELVAGVRDVAAAVAPGSPVEDVRTLQALVDASLAPLRFSLGLMAGFGILALVLSAIGIYGVISFLVAQRTRELGVRIALGMAPGAARRQVMREGLSLVAVALALGVVVAASLGHLADDVLYGVTPLDPATWMAATFVLACVAALACWIPARRATRVDPVDALADRA